jgi:adenylate kinase family enzyme
MRRVMVIGGAGAGKSRLARQIGARFGLPVIHLDAIYWQAGWRERPREEAVALVRAAAEGEVWVMDGNYSDSMRDRLVRADTLVFLDLPSWRRLARLVRRMLTGHGRVRPDMAEGCPERFDLGFLRWAAGYRRDGRIRALALLEKMPPHIKVHRLSSPAEVRAFVMHLPRP